jgi:hypothetical protein
MSGPLLLEDRVSGLAPLRVAASEVLVDGFTIPELPPLKSGYFEIRVGSE